MKSDNKNRKPSTIPTLEEMSNKNGISGGDVYAIGGVITGFIIFIGVWIYAIASWGFLIGICFGWIPAIIAAVIAGILWPLIALIVVIILFISAFFVLKSYE